MYESYRARLNVRLNKIVIIDFTTFYYVNCNKNLVVDDYFFYHWQSKEAKILIYVTLKTVNLVTAKMIE